MKKQGIRFDIYPLAMVAIVTFVAVVVVISGMKQASYDDLAGEAYKLSTAKYGCSKHSTTTCQGGKLVTSTRGTDCKISTKTEKCAYFCAAGKCLDETAYKKLLEKSRGKGSPVYTGGVGSTTYAECNDSTDNDGDGLTDYPADPGCSSASDTDETNPVCYGEGQSTNGICHSPYGCNALNLDSVKDDCSGELFIGESCTASAGAGKCVCCDTTGTPRKDCDDDIDNDGDGLIDYPNDPGCSSASDDDETDDVDCAMAGYSCTTEFAKFSAACIEAGGTTTQSTSCTTGGTSGQCVICNLPDQTSDVPCTSGTCYADPSAFVCIGTTSQGASCVEGGVSGTCMICTKADIPCDTGYTCVSNYKTEAGNCAAGGGEYLLGDTCRVGTTEGRCFTCEGGNLLCPWGFTCESDAKLFAETCSMKGGEYVSGEECRAETYDGLCMSCEGALPDPCAAKGYVCTSNVELAAKSCQATGGEFAQTSQECTIGKYRGYCTKCVT
jgi:hypothetical protein